MANIKATELTDEAKRLRVFRQSEGLNQEDFSEPLSVTRSVITKYEKGYLNIPFEIIKEIHLKYNMSLHWFATGKGDSKHIPEKSNLTRDVPILITNYNLLITQVESLKAELFKLHRDFHAYRQESSVQNNS